MKTENYSTIIFTDIFDLEEIQKMQDLFADATGVASLITNPDGIPITRPSNFCRLCNEIRKTEKGRTNCFKSDAIIGKMHKSEPLLERCLSVGLLDSGANITVGGHHVANWLIGQVRNERVDEQQIINYADEIGANKEDFLRAYHEVPEMSVDQFSKVSKMLFVFANQLSEKAFQNLRLKQSEAKFQSLFMNMSEGASLHELIYNNEGVPVDYKIIETNPAFTRQLGISRESAIGKKSREVYNVDEPPYLEIYSQVALTGEPTIFEAYFPPLKKHFSISVYCPSKGSFATIFENITERKKTEQALNILLTKYQVLFDTLPIGITITDSNGKIIESNQNAEILLGLSREEQEKRTIGGEEWRIIRTDGTPMPVSEYAGIRALAEGRQVENIEMGIVNNPDQTTWINVSAAPIPLQGYGVAITYYNITDRRQAEMKLQISEAQKNAILNGISANIAFVDKDLNIIWANKTASDSVNKSPDEMVGRTCHHFWADPSKPCEDCPSLKAIESKKSQHTIMYTPDGSVWDERGEPIFDANGDLLGVVEIATDITENELAKQKLRNSQLRYEELVRRIPAGIYSLHMNPDGVMKFVFCSSKFCEITGLAENDVLNDSNCVYTTIHPDDHESMTEANCYAAKTLEPFRWEGRCIVNGEIRWIQIESEPTDLTDGNSLWNGVVMDITDRKRTELLLRESEEKYRSILQASPDDITITDLEGRILMVSPAALQIIGCKDENELIGHFLDEFIVPEDRKRAKSNISLMLQGVMTGLGSYHGLRADGSVFEMEANAEFIRDANGLPSKMVFIVRDVSERRYVEKALQASEEKHRVLFENSPDAYLIILNGKFTDCNKAAENLLCGTKEQIIGQPPDALSPEFQPNGELSEKAAKNRISQAIENGFIAFEWVHKRLDGSEFLAEISIAGMQIDGQTALFSVIRDITKRNKIEEALRESEEKHRFLIENNQDIIYTLNREGVFTFVSPSWTTQLGHHLDQVTGKSFYHFVHPDDLPRCYEFLKKIIRPNQVNEGVEYRVKHLNGSWLWHFSTAVPLKNEAGIVTGFQGTGRDISQRKLAETALKESEEKYRTLVETMTDGVYRSTHDGKFIEVNPAMVKILGYDSKEELLSIDIKTQLYYSEEERESADLDEKLEEMAIFRLRKKDGSEIWVEDHGRHVLDEKGNILFHEGALRDVTERKLAEFALQRSEENYRSLIENMGEGVAFTNQDNVFIFANPSAEKIFGVEKGKLQGINLFDFLSVENIASIKSGIQQHISGKSSVIELEICLFDGSKKHILLTATPSFAKNKFIGTFGIFRDITERKKAEYEINLKNETLQTLNATKDKFFSIIAHDLKSPFNSIMGFSELLVEQISTKDYDGIEKYARIILKSSERAVDLLANLMEWSRSQTGRIEFNPEFIEMVELISEIELLFDEIAGQKSIVIKRDLPRHAPVFADKPMINTVLRNLISNAIKFTKPGGKIIISLNEKPDEITVSVKDSGVGISPDRIDKLFRLDESYSTPGTNNEKGTGLGLILCKEFIEKHGGKIWVESHPDSYRGGKGSTFTFTLPTNLNR